MSDKITVNTDKMAGFVRDLQRISDKLNDNASTLRRADFSECGGGGVVDSQRIYLKCSGRTISGSRAPSLVDSFADGLTATGRYIDTLARNVKEVLSRFEEAENEIVAMGEGEEDENRKSTVVFNAYEPAYESAQEMLKIKTPEWEKNDTFIDTAYDKAIKAELERLIMTDPDFSQESWDACTVQGDPKQTNKNREALLRRVCEKIQSAMGTELSGGFYISTQQSGKPDEIDVLLKGGITATVKFGDTSAAEYYTDEDCIVVRVSEADYTELIGTLCHENRHNLQMEMVQTENLRDSKYVMSEEEFAGIMKEVAEWSGQSMPGGYYSYGGDDIEARQQEIWKEFSLWERITKQKTMADAENYAVAELYERYGKQSVEVDARYMEQYVEWMMQLRVMKDVLDEKRPDIVGVWH